MAIAALAIRSANPLRDAHRCLTYFCSLAQSGPSIHPAPPSPLLVSPSPPLFPPVTERFGIGSCKSTSFGQRWSFSTANNGTATSAGAIKSESSDKTAEEAKSGGGGSGSQQTGKSVRGGPVSWMSFLLLLATGIGIVYYYDREKKRHIEEINKTSLAVKEGPSVGKAAIGGPFNLIDHDGKPVTEKHFVGKWTIMYFGFTHCPDICPTELEKLVDAVDKIKKEAGIEIVPVFISVDPERDSVEQVREYVKGFHKKLVGLTGSPEEIKKTARAYRVYYMKTEEEDSDYLVDHSIVMYLMGPDMEFVKFFGKNNDVNSLSEGVIKEIKQYKSKKYQV